MVDLTSIILLVLLIKLSLSVLILSVQRLEPSQKIMPRQIMLLSVALYLNHDDFVYINLKIQFLFYLLAENNVHITV